MPGPLPTGNARRRNAPTIPTTRLPAGGRTAPAPRLPSFVQLGKTGRAWWSWAWKTPQAAAWAEGMEAAVARRATLEDDLAAITVAGRTTLADVLDLEPSDQIDAADRLFEHLARLAGGKLAILREMRELDDRLGLTPKAMAALRWSIVADEVSEARESKTAPAPKRPRLMAVDSAVAGA